jgi:hypothetical protein
LPGAKRSGRKASGSGQTSGSRWLAQSSSYRHAVCTGTPLHSRARSSGAPDPGRRVEAQRLVDGQPEVEVGVVDDGIVGGSWNRKVTVDVVVSWPANISVMTSPRMRFDSIAPSSSVARSTG